MRTIYLACVAGASVTAASAILAPPVPPAALACVGATLVAAMGLGVAFPGLGVFGPAVSRVHGARGLIALTFDDGPHPRNTRRVLDALERAGARATFFLVAERVDRYSELAREIAERGHEVALHSHGHDDLLALRRRRAVTRDFERAEEVFVRALGGRPTLYRPPAGVASPTIHVVARERGYLLVGWSIRALDGVRGRRSAPERVRDRVARRAAAGDVVLLHDSLRGHEEDVPGGVEALEGILEDLAARRLRAVTVSELVAALPR